MKKIPNYINHVVLVLDASWSMDENDNSKKLVKVVDKQIEYLAKRSEELNQETRISIYEFANTVSCLVYDMDVLRLPSIEALYHTHGQTALIDATLKSLDDLSQTATLYGDHAFLAYVFTDGYNNASRNRPGTLKQRLNTLPPNWTVAALVPGRDERDAAISFGFPADNVAIWDAASAEGVIEVGKTIQDATENFMQARSRGGFVGTRSLFSTGLDAVNADTVRTALTPLSQSDYWVFPVHTNPQRADGKFPIQDFLNSRGVQFVPGHSYYQLTKTEKVQPQKNIAIRERSTGKVYTGSHARDVLGLPAGFEVKVKPDYNPEYDVFVQSTSTNRVLMPSTDLLVLR